MEQTSRWQGFTEQSLRRRDLPILVLGLLAVIVGILYAPSINAPFQGDDFNWLRHLMFRFQTLLDGREWDLFLSPFWEPGVWLHFRPGFQLLFVLDYTAWGLDPFGYHLTSVILHVLSAFLVFVVGWQLTHSRLVAITAGVLFAVMPIHVEAVAWFAARADGLSALWLLLSLVFYIMYRERGRISFLIFSAIAFAMSLMAKEAGVTLPLLIAVYDFLYQRDKQKGIRQLVTPELPLWLLLIGYLALRMALLGSLGSYVGSHLLGANLGYFSSIYLTELTDPFLPDIAGVMQVALIAWGVIALIVFRSRRQVIFGLIWMGLTILPSFSSQDGVLFDRFAYLPTVGLALVLASVLAQPSKRFFVWGRVAALGVLVLLVLAYSLALYNRNGEYANSAQVTRLVTDQIHKLHPTLPADARVYVKGLPGVAVTRGVQTFGWVVNQAMQITYDNLKLEAYGVDKFPLLVDHLDRSYFFEYHRRNVTERADLISVLYQRSQCATFSAPILEWNFTNGIQDWEAWNELADFGIHDGTLTMQAQGNDPYMASPAIDIPAEAIGDIEITMRVRGNPTTMHGAVYWLATDQPDFFPGFRKQFDVRADGEFHTYRVDIVETGQLFVGDHIVRLRLNPVDAPADIAIQTIRVNVHCATIQDEHCFCAP